MVKSKGTVIPVPKQQVLKTHKKTKFRALLTFPLDGSSGQINVSPLPPLNPWYTHWTRDWDWKVTKGLKIPFTSSRIEKMTLR